MYEDKTSKEDNESKATDEKEQSLVSCNKSSLNTLAAKACSFLNTFSNIFIIHYFYLSNLLPTT